MGETSSIDQDASRRAVIVLATVVYVMVAVVWIGDRVSATVRPAGIVVGVPGCVVDPADILGWWRGDSAVAAIGPDLTGSIASAPGLIGQALVFDGASVASIDAFPTVSTAVTVEAWVKPVDTGSIQTIFSRWDFPSTDDSARSYALFLAPGGQLTWSTDETSTRRPAEPSVQVPGLYDGFYHHIAATWDQSTAAVYVDGNQVLSVPSQGGVLNPAGSTQFRLGSKAGIGSPFFFQGLLDEPAVIARALTATQIRDLFGAGPNGKCLPPPVMTAGASGATAGAAARWKGENSGGEIFVGPLLSPSALPRAEAEHAWSPGTSFDVTVTHDAAANTLTATAAAGTVGTATFDFDLGGAPGCPSAAWDVMDLMVVDSRSDAGIRLAAVELNGEGLGDVGAVDVAGTPGGQSWSITGADLSQDFEFTGRIEVGGVGFVGNEALRVQATVGCSS